MNPLLRSFAAALAVVWIAFAPVLQAHPVGSGGGGPPLFTVHEFEPGPLPGWTVGTPTDPIAITAVPDHAPWLKIFLGLPPLVPFSTVFTVTEHIMVGQPGFPGPEWTDWHEHILTPGWDWVGGTILAGGAVLPGLVVSLGPAGLLPDLGHSPAIWFDFDPVAPGTQLTIVKQIHCHTQPDCFGGPIQVSEYPTIPEPASLALVGIALLGLARARRAR